MVKAPLEAELRSLLTVRKRKGTAGTVYVNAYDSDGLYEKMRSIGDPRRLPGVMAHLGFGPFFHTAFRERFVDRGVFEAAAFPRSSRNLLERGFIDPEGRYTVLAVNPMVIVADHTRLGARPLPRRWADILEPRYEKSVGVVGRGPSFNEALCLAIHREFGLPGIGRLARAVCFTGHPAEMVKAAGKAAPGAPAISIMDYFFAKMIRHQDRISIIWPEEGALAIPFLALVRKDRIADAGDAIRFLTGAAMAQTCADAYFYPVNADVSPRLPESLRLNWPGWDYLRRNDLEALMNEIGEESARSFEGGTG